MKAPPPRLPEDIGIRNAGCLLAGHHVPFPVGEALVMLLALLPFN
jgi:hypothetical protein